MLDLIDEAYEQGHSACYSEDLFYTLVWQNKSFYDLYESGSPISISREVRERVASIFGRLPKWSELPFPEPAAFEVQIEQGDEVWAPSIAWAHEQLIKDRSCAVACIIFPHGRPAGFLSVNVNRHTESLWFVANSQNYCDFFRWLITDTTKNPNEMESFAPSAFPAIDFVPGAFNGIKNMSKSYRELVKPLVSHLSVLSDQGKRIFEGDWRFASAEFGSWGVVISDENGNTKGNKEARKERTIKVDGTDITFWWHCKLEPDRDRIHLYPDRISTGGRLMVGIFCNHLQT